MPEPQSPLPGRRRAQGARDEGSISLLFAGVAIAVLLLIGLVVDGGGRLRAVQRADSLAAEAARAAAQAIDPAAAIQDGAVHMSPDPGVPAATARAYLARAGASGTVSVGADRVTLTVTVTVPFKPVFSGMLTDGSVSATARVTLVHGVIAPEGKTS
ncbi:pilus assembly protein TadG-related protein [Embleya sp. NPDC127516]|uniref:pilus assembly protein TadG-related protein n=1 Tax=Embleya sp. NPDC127516 TaxID=3363990 RepID=UPI00380B4D95